MIKNGYKLVDKTGREISEGDVIHGDDDDYKVLEGHPPRHHNSTGHVTVESVSDGHRPGMAGYCYVTVFNLRWKPVIPIAALRDDVTGSTPWL